MTVYELISILQDVQDKEMPVVMPIEVGFISACVGETGVAKDDEGEDIFVILPCFCHVEEVDDTETTLDVLASDFDIELN